MGGQRIFCSTTPFLVGSRLASTRRQDNTNNETIKGKCFSKNEDENHSNKKFWLLCIGSNTGITNNTNSHASRKASQATGKTRREMCITIKEVIGFGLWINTGTDNNSNNKAINTQNSSHDNRNNRLHHQLRSHYTHGSHAHATLRCAIGSSHTGEDEGSCGAKEAEKRCRFITAEGSHNGWWICKDVG
uniref:Uncharacterized protein n=1 Tax=Glycine max TaxID=3847 RepID=C6SZC3_SOYBN|nr:unknown [Glycine max]